MSEKWPRLSYDLAGPRRTNCCQSCSAEGSIDTEITYWMEADDNDKFSPLGWTDRIVALCKSCSEHLIEPHPRLYHPLPNHEPKPGIMLLCIGCKHSQDLGCRSTLLKANGGPGMAVHHPQPIIAHICGTIKGRRTGWMKTYYSGSPTQCEGREDA